MNEQSRIYLVDGRREMSILGSPETFVRILAAVTSNPGDINELLHEASYFDETVGPELTQQAEDITVRTAEFRVDFKEHRLVYPSDVVPFARRGGLPLKTADGVEGPNVRTYAVPPHWEIYDTSLGRPLDEKASIRREKDMWSGIVGDVAGGNVAPRAEALLIDGLTLGAMDVQDLVVWTKTADDGPPTVNGRSVYELRMVAGTRNRPALNR